MNDFLDHLANHQYQKLQVFKGETPADMITPETYEEMNKEFIEEGTAVRISPMTQEEIDEWMQWKDPDMHLRDVEPFDAVAEMWEKHNEKEIEINFGSEYESGIDYT